MKIPLKISKQLRKRYGKFNYKLIYTNKQLKNYVYKLDAEKGIFVLKLMGGKDIKNRIEKEINGRKYFKEKILPLVQRAKVTELDYWNFKDKYIITKYEEIITLRELMNKDSKEFFNLINWIYSEFFLKIKKLNAKGKIESNKIKKINEYPKGLRKEIIELNNKAREIAKKRKSYKLYGEFSLYDLNYQKPYLYFIDFEDFKNNADLMEDYTDLFAKIFKIYVKSRSRKLKIADEYKKCLKKILFLSRKNLNKEELKIFELYFKMKILYFYLQDPKYKNRYLKAYNLVRNKGLR